MAHPQVADGGTASDTFFFVKFMNFHCFILPRCYIIFILTFQKNSRNINDYVITQCFYTIQAETRSSTDMQTVLNQCLSLHIQNKLAYC